MLKREYLRVRNDGVHLYKTYSIDGFYIKQIETGAIYDEAIDVENAPYTYIQIDIPIEPREEDDSNGNN